jgi:hypothetical protein
VYIHTQDNKEGDGDQRQEGSCVCRKEVKDWMRGAEKRWRWWWGHLITFDWNIYLGKEALDSMLIRVGTCMNRDWVEIYEDTSCN